MKERTTIEIAGRRYPALATYEPGEWRDFAERVSAYHLAAVPLENGWIVALTWTDEWDWLGTLTSPAEWALFSGTAIDPDDDWPDRPWCNCAETDVPGILAEWSALPMPDELRRPA